MTHSKDEMIKQNLSRQNLYAEKKKLKRKNEKKEILKIASDRGLRDVNAQYDI